MSTPPNQRRRRGKPPERPTRQPSDSAEAESSERSSDPAPAAPPAPPARRTFNSNVIWALITGLAVGFAVGREAYRFGLGGSQAAPSSSAPSTAFIAADNAPAHVYAKMADFPAGWV